MGRSPRGGHGNPFQYSCLENPMDKEAWWATVRGAPKSRIQLSDLAQHIHGVELIPVLNIKDGSNSHVSDTSLLTSKVGPSIVNLSSDNFIRRKKRHAKHKQQSLLGFSLCTKLVVWLSFSNWCTIRLDLCLFSSFYPSCFSSILLL